MAGVAKLPSAGRIPPADQFNPSSPPNALHIFSSTEFAIVDSSATQDWLLPVFC